MNYDMHICILAVSYILLVNSIRDYITSVIVLFSIALYIVYGFVVNDYFDRPYDIMANKIREIYSLSERSHFFIIIVITAIAFTFVYLLNNIKFAVMYLISYILAFFYSAPLLRFKEKGFIGVFVNCLIEKTLPIAAIFAYYNIFDTNFTLFVLSSFWIHFADILTHQIKDYEADIKTNVRTFVVNIGIEKALSLYRKIVCPVTLILVSTLIFAIIIHIPYTIYLILSIVAIYILIYIEISKERFLREEKIFPLYLSCLFLIVHNALPVYLSFMLVILKDYRYLPIFVFSLLSQYYIIKYKIIKPITDKRIPPLDAFD